MADATLMKPPRSKLRGIRRKGIGVRHHGFSETVAEILDSIWTGQVITFILPVPTIFSQGSQRCLDRVHTCQTPPRALSTSRTSQYPNWDCIAETISTPPVHDVAISPLATPRTSAPCTTWAIEAPVARLTSW